MRLLCALAFLTVSLAAACGGGGEPDVTSTPPAPVAATATPSLELQPSATPVIEAPARPPPDQAPVTSLATLEVIADGEELPFKLCGQQLGWQKPGPEEMAPVFQDLRFGDGTAPFPQDYTYYLRDFYFPYVYSASGNKYWTNFGGFQLTGDQQPPPQTFCDEADLRAQGTYRVIRTIDSSVVGVRRLGNTLVVVVEAGFYTGWDEVVFPYPPSEPAFADDGVKFLRVVNAGGDTLYEEAIATGGEAWFQWLQYRPAGALDFLVIGGILPYATTQIEILAGQPALRLYSSSPAVSDRDGSLVAVDENGLQAGRIDWSGEFGMWQSLGTLSLPPGRYTLRFEDEANDWRHFVLLAADVLRPPGAAAGLRHESLPDAAAILASGDDVPFRVCHVVSKWERPGLEAMSEVFTHPRFGDKTVPFPAYYAMYLEHVYYVLYPTANSANIEWNAFSGFSASGDVERACEPPDTSGLAQRYGAPGKSSRPFYQSLALAGYHALDMRREGANLVVVVEPAPSTWEVAFFPYPADPAFFEADIGFESVQVVDTDGEPVHVEARIPEATWHERIQYSESGQLDQVVLFGDGHFSTTELVVPAGQEAMTLYGGLGAPLASTPAGRLVALDAAGNELASIEWEATDAVWQALGAVSLPEETRRLRIETAQAGQAGFWFPFVLIREGLPLPAGVRGE